MDKELKQKWVSALRSGDYKQGFGALKREKDQPVFCCLGVLCEVAGNQISDDFGDRERYYIWVRSQITDMRAAQLQEMNDDRGSNFTEIADWIEERL